MNKTWKEPPILSTAFMHGLYLFLSGIWPLLHMQSFLEFTGAKTDLWLVRTAGMLSFVIGTGVISAVIAQKLNMPVILILVGTTIGFILIDTKYVAEDVISNIYLLDAGIEVLFLLIWLYLFIKFKNKYKFAESDKM